MDEELPDDRPDDDYDYDIPDDVPYRPMDESNIPTRSSTLMEKSGTIEGVEGANKTLMIEQLYKELGVEGDVNLTDRDRFKVTRDSKTNHTMLYFLKADRVREHLTRKNGKFRAIKEIRRIMGAVNAMKGMLSLDETPPLLEKSIQAARDLKNAVQAAADLNDKTDLEMDSIQLEDLSHRLHDVDTAPQKASKDAGLPCARITRS